LWGIIPQGHGIDSVTLVIIALAVGGILLLLNPKALDRLKLFELGIFKLELLEQVKDKQAKQESQLEDISLIIQALLPDTEQGLLKALANKETEREGSPTLRASLLLLRRMRFIEMRPDEKTLFARDAAICVP
jgi:hypothetical protein